jgi:hypothetical protein
MCFSRAADIAAKTGKVAVNMVNAKIRDMVPFEFPPGVAGNNVPWNKCPGNNIFYCNDLNLRS